MTLRSGMVTIIDTWRRMVDDANSAIWTDDQAQEILDRQRADFWEEQLAPIPLLIDGSAQYRTYASAWENVEGTASGTTAWRLYTSNGSAATSAYTVNAERGLVTFTADQGGTTYYLDGRSYDLAGAAADGWQERMAKVSGWYSFESEGKRFSRSDYFKHCQAMAEYYRRHSKPMYTTIR